MITYIERYSPLSWADSLRSPIVFYMSDKLFIARFLFVLFFEYPPKWCTDTGMAGATWKFDKFCLCEEEKKEGKKEKKSDEQY